MRLKPSPHPIVVRPEPKFTTELVFSLHHRRARDATGLFLAEGARFLSQAIEHSSTFAGLVICPPRLAGSFLREQVTLLERAGVPLIKVGLKEYVSLSPGTSMAGENIAAGQGVIAILRQAWEPGLPETGPSDLWIGIESVRSAGNLGTLLRGGAATGATGLIVFDRSEGGSESGADPYDPNSVRATMGALFSHRLVRTTHRAFRRQAAGKIAVVGATGEALLDFRSTDFCRPSLIMLGDERQGLSDGQRKSCGSLVRIPMVGSPDSLNLAMAGTLMLYEAFRQRNPEAAYRRDAD
jgi:TrmH family RNA methyltransferase